MSHIMKAVYLYNGDLQVNLINSSTDIRYAQFYLNINSTQTPQWIDYLSDQLLNSYKACGYNTGDLVKCEIRAGTKVGYGPEATGYVRVTLGNPHYFAFQSN
ncbi:hypothetical protein EB796_002002 [Bugula neritina]|uniref:Uncharacterized protein n=1 Tax=Bugula neritina TaxID=10212 RepID=A0A7J7KNF7_BUGNE|nr:hypothetical protein EB796_002002 [Bugula neritina]